MAKWQRIALGIAALIAWVVLEGVSISANVKFAFTLGHTDLERYILAGGSVASDLLKAAAPVAVLYFLATRRWTAMWASVAVSIVAVMFSILSATGFVSGERFRAYHEAKAQVEHTKELREEVEKEAANKAWIPDQLKPLPVLEAEKAAAEQDRRWKVTDGCTNARNANERWCRDVRQLDVQIAAAKASSDAMLSIEEKREVIATKGRDYGDAQIEFISNVTSLDEHFVLLATIMLAVALIELGSSLGLTIALGLLSPPESKLGKTLGTAFSVIKGSKPTEKVMITPVDVSKVPKSPPKPPAPEDLRKVSQSFDEPVAIIPAKPDAGGLRGKMRPVSLTPPKKLAIA